MQQHLSISLSLLLGGTCLVKAEKYVSPCFDEKPWNFVMILLDDAGWRDLGFTGNEFIETPNLDKLASEAVQFTSAYATDPFCSPTRQSLMSGLYPARTAWMKKSELKKDTDQINGPSFSPAGSHKWTTTWPEFIPLAEHLKRHGYATGHVGKWHFLAPESVTPESLGFDLNFGGHHMVGAVRDFFAPFEGLPGDVKSTPGEYLTDRLTNETISFIEKNRNQPFYVQLWHYAPHDPIMAPENLVEKYRLKMKAGEYQDVNPTYAAMIDAVDIGVGKIISRLKDLGLEERTIIILASDNGGVKSFGSVPVTSMYPLRGEKGLLYEGGIRIPMFIKIPGVTEPGVKSEKLVSVVDIYPTILDLAGINITSGQKIDGYSLKPILNGEHQNELDERIHIWYNALHGIKDHNGEVSQPRAAIQKNRWKLIRKFNHSEELYDLNNDPSESVNLAKYLPQVQNHLSTLLDSCLETTGLSLPRPNPNFDPDFLMARQVPNELFYQLNLKPVQSWNGEALSAWQASNDCELTNGMDFIRMHALDGTYPRISSERLNNAREGTFLVKIRLRITVPGGRIRFHWSEEKPENAVIELFPERNGDWEEFTGIFRTQSSLQSIGLAGPTHLGKLGFYKHGTDSRYMDVESIELFLVE